MNTELDITAGIKFVPSPPMLRIITSDETGKLMSLIDFNDGDKWLKVLPDGTVEGNMPLTDAAKMFWKVVSENYPLPQRETP